jgi:DNA-binding MarR family transcriptional regulator
VGNADAIPPYRFGDLLALARRSWIRQVRAHMDAAGFPGYRQTDSWLLRLLIRQPWAIGEAMGVTRQAARKLAGGLAERGYAVFTADSSDARRTLVVLTPAGETYAHAVASAQDALNNSIRARVPAADLAAADSVLRAVFSADARRRVDASVPPPTG